MAWLAGCRRLHRRYERKADHFLAFTSITCTLICYRRLANWLPTCAYRLPGWSLQGSCRTRIDRCAPLPRARMGHVPAGFEA